MKRLLYILLLTLIAPLSLGITTPAQATEKSWQVTNWDFHAIVDTGSTIAITETVTYRFTGNFHFVDRYILKNRIDKITDFTVFDNTNPAAHDLTYTFTDLGDRYNIHINFAAQDEQRTFVFAYTLHGGVGYFDDHDEFFWNVLPSDMAVPTSAITADVVIPSGVTVGDLMVRVDGDGKDQDARIVNAHTIAFSGNNFPSSSNFTIVAGWPTGLITNPGVYRFESKQAATGTLAGSATTFKTPFALRTGFEVRKDEPQTVTISKFGYASQDFHFTPATGKTTTFHADLKITLWYAILLIVGAIIGGIYVLHPLIVFIVLWLRWRKKGRDPKGRGTIIAQYDPPDHLPPTLVGVLVDETVDLHEITASIIDLAYRGYLHITELPKKTFQAQDYELGKKKEWRNDTTLHPYEKELLDDIFGSAQKIQLSDLKNKFYKNLPGLKETLYQEITDLGYFEANPEKKRRTYILVGVTLIAFGLFGSSFYGAGIPLMITGIIVMIFGRIMPKRTPKGVAATEWAQGFKDYLYTAERYRVQKLTPELFEKFLAYAMVFKIEKEWATKFKDIYKGQPDWYTGSSTHLFTASLLANHMSSLGTAATTNFAATPGGSSASGSSGFSGGGFSGGGGGGGGMSAG